MGLTNRPYVGSWQLGQKELVQHTPDALVYINGDVSIPGCPKCNGKIDVQQFVTEVSVDAGTDPGAMSASFTLSVPVHHNESFARDARFIIRPGLEVHIYFRGYFPVKGLYSNLDDPRNVREVTSAGELPKEIITQRRVGTKKDDFPASLEGVDFSKVPEGLVDKWLGRGMDELGGVLGQRATVAAGVAEIIEKYWQQRYPDAKVTIEDHHRGPGDKGNHSAGGAIDYVITYNGGQDTVPNLQSWAGTQRLIDEGRIPPGGNGIYINGKTTKGTGPNDQGATSKRGCPPGSSSAPHYDFRGSYGWGERRANKDGSPTNWVWVDTNGQGGHEYGPSDRPPDRKGSKSSLAWLNDNGLGDVNEYIRKRGKNDGSIPAVGDNIPNLQQQLGQEEMAVVNETQPGDAIEEKPNEDVVDPTFSQSLLDEIGLSGFGLEDVLAYPYYHVFRGVITQVGHSYSTGVQSISVSCASMLHFWQYHRVSTNASLFGARPTNSKLTASVVGHNYTGMHPYEIIYTLHNDVAGSAAGVSWALTQKTNQDARSPVNSESLFSLNIKYWEERFKTKETKLRMHGVTGELFSAAQAAFLGSTSSTELTSLVRGRFNLKQSVRSEILQQSIALGLTRNRRLEALIQQRQTRDTEAGVSSTPQFELNMIEMQAFVTNIGNWGNFNDFESTYESKMDIAQRVCEVTGFEFFQDVDGDFVFKPPMYNLDTSSARVYRIEDIDIININFNEQEPQVTYMTGKGPGFKNFEGSGLENEWGVRGQYIDYRLVAQFGWRPGDFEASYFNDPKSMFFAAINRMDVMNAPMNGAQLSIPMRPELRPGYPIYIQYLDCFYYCPSFAHSYGVGGQATTALTLQAKRAKFYAPGDPSKNGIEAIDLKDSTLPQRPLQVLDNAGRPRLAGFPNVVMALDVQQLNPLFLIVGADVDMIDNPDTLANLLKMAEELKVIRPASLNDVAAASNLSKEAWGNLDARSTENLYIVDIGENETQLLYFRNPFDQAANPQQGSPTKPSGAVDLLAAAQTYTAAQELQIEKLQEQQSQINNINTQIVILNQNIQLAQSQNYESYAQYEEYILQRQQEVANLEKQRQQFTDEYTQSQKDFESYLSSEDNVGIRWLVGLIKKLGEAFGESYTSRGQGRSSDLKTTNNLLDILSNKKAAMIGGNIPGDFRYYSASHPDPKHQGQLEVSFQSRSAADQSPSTDTATTSTAKYRSPYLEGLWKNTTVEGFVPSNQVTYPTGSIRPEAKLATVSPKWGIRVLTNNPEQPQGEILPTSEIRELMFATHSADISRRIISTKRRRKVSNGEKNIREALQKSALGETQRYRQGDPVQTLTDIFGDWLETFYGRVDDAYEAAKNAPGVDPSTVPAFPALQPITSLIVGGSVFAFDTTIGADYRFSDMRPNAVGVPEAWPGSSKNVTLRTFWERAAGELGIAAYRAAMSAAKYQWFSAMQGAGLPYTEAEYRLALFEQALGGYYGAAMPSVEKAKDSSKAKREFRLQTPVFPVSDARGYEVFGSYRYGRDVDIDPNGVFDSLHNQSPLDILDKHQMDLILRVIVRKEGLYTDVEVTDENGRVKTDRNGNPVTRKELLQGQDAYDEASKQVIAALRREYTDKQLLDLGLATRTGNPNMLEVNFMNWFSEKGKEGVQKLPINNAAYSLADMTLHTNKRICSCKMAEAEVMLDAAGQDNFLDFAAPAQETAETAGTGEEDRPTQWLMAEVARQSGAWKTSQDALRGTVPDNRRSTIVSTFTSTQEAFRSQLDSISAQKRDLYNQRKSLEAQADQVRDRVEIVNDGEL